MRESCGLIDCVHIDPMLCTRLEHRKQRPGTWALLTFNIGRHYCLHVFQGKDSCQRDTIMVGTGGELIRESLIT